MKKINRSWKEILPIYSPLVLLVLISFFIAFQYIKPAPPNHITIASGEKGGAYHKFALHYQKLLKAQGITLEIISSVGSVENLRLLTEEKADIAFIQGGVAEGNRISQQLEGLGSLYFEPLWLFHRKDLQLQRIPDLKGLRVAIGPDGSGTQALVKLLLEDNALQESSSVKLLLLKSSEAVERLSAGTIDAAFFVASPESQLVSGLLHDERIRLTSFKRASAYARRNDFLSRLTLPEGAEDLSANIPPQDIQLLATTSGLVIHNDLHPAIISLMMQVADKVHRPAGWFNSEGEFPTTRYMSFPLNEQADRYYRRGPPFLQRYLPFWIASLLDRMKIMILPLLGLMLPLFKVVPPLYRWRMRSRIYRWYEELEEVDRECAEQPGNKRNQLQYELDRIEVEVRDIKVPLSFSYQLYHLRLHIDFVRGKLAQDSQIETEPDNS